MTDFRNWLKDKEYELPPGFDDDNRIVLRFLQGLKWDYMATYTEIHEHHKWK